MSVLDIQGEIDKHQSRLQSIRADIDLKLRLMNGAKVFIILSMAWVFCGFATQNWIDSFDKCAITFLLMVVWSGLGSVLFFFSNEGQLLHLNRCAIIDGA